MFCPLRDIPINIFFIPYLIEDETPHPVTREHGPFWLLENLHNWRCHSLRDNQSYYFSPDITKARLCPLYQVSDHQIENGKLVTVFQWTKFTNVWVTHPNATPVFGIYQNRLIDMVIGMSETPPLFHYLYADDYLLPFDSQEEFTTLMSQYF